MKTIDCFETAPRDSGGRVTKGWRVTRYSFGALTVQHLRSGQSKTGVVDCFGDVVYPLNDIHAWRMDTDEIVPFYLEGCLPPHFANFNIRTNYPKGVTK